MSKKVCLIKDADIDDLYGRVSSSKTEIIKPYGRLRNG